MLGLSEAMRGALMWLSYKCWGLQTLGLQMLGLSEAMRGALMWLSYKCWGLQTLGLSEAMRGAIIEPGVW